jgi:hypothetical protein
MTAAEFRKMALGFPGAIESAHVNHPDFRLNGRVFATLGYPSDKWGMVKLTPEQQRLFVAKEPDMFGACRGTWGKRGATSVSLASVSEEALGAALADAFNNVGARSRKDDT